MWLLGHVKSLRLSVSLCDISVIKANYVNPKPRETPYNEIIEQIISFEIHLCVWTLLAR